MDDIQRMQTLIERLNAASKAYYDGNDAVISDDEWDAMYAELRRLEETTGQRLSDSPTRRVGGEVLSGFEPHRHIARLWSMDKAQSKEEILAWAQRCERLTAEAGGLPRNEYCVEYKLDGDTLTVRAERRNKVEKKDQDKVVRMERSYGSYSRSFDISGIDPEGIKAKYTDGVLQLTLPKREELPNTARHIEIE